MKDLPLPKTFPICPIVLAEEKTPPANHKVRVIGTKRHRSHNISFLNKEDDSTQQSAFSLLHTHTYTSFKLLSTDSVFTSSTFMLDPHVHIMWPPSDVTWHPDNTLQYYSLMEYSFFDLLLYFLESNFLCNILFILPIVLLVWPIHSYEKFSGDFLHKGNLEKHKCEGKMWRTDSQKWLLYYDISGNSKYNIIMVFGRACTASVEHILFICASHDSQRSIFVTIWSSFFLQILLKHIFVVAFLINCILL